MCIGKRKESSYHKHWEKYLKSIIGKFRELKIEPPIYIFFHKYDPVFVSKDYKETHEFIQNLELLIRSVSDNKFVFYKTSIYSIKASFSQF